MTINASLLSRVKKLLALADNNPDIHEAEAAMAKAQEMIAKYNISEAFLKVETGDDGSHSTVIKQMIHKSGRVATWLAALANTVGEVNGCAVYIVRGSGIMCVGDEADIALVEVLVNYLEGEVIRHCKASCARRSMDRAQGRIFANRFKMGAITALCQRLRETKAKVEEEVKALPNGSYALTIISNKLVRAKKALPKLTKSTVRHRACADGYAEGQRAGVSIKLTPENNRLRG